VLKGIAVDINGELKRQDPEIEQLNVRVDKTRATLETLNTQLSKTLKKVYIYHWIIYELRSGVEDRTRSDQKRKIRLLQNNILMLFIVGSIAKELLLRLYSRDVLIGRCCRNVLHY